MIIIVGSRRDGNSLKLANKVCSVLDDLRIKSQIIIPGNQVIHLCTGCMDCDKSGVCDFTDDMKNNIEALEKDDTIMFINPTRWNLVSGDIKIFMDRLNPMYSNRKLKGKKGIIVSIGAKPKDIYSTYASTVSIRNFLESAEMECMFTYEFNECKDSEDILYKTEELNEFIKELKTNLQKN